MCVHSISNTDPLWIGEPDVGHFKCFHLSNSIFASANIVTLKQQSKVTSLTG